MHIHTLTQNPSAFTHKAFFAHMWIYSGVFRPHALFAYELTSMCLKCYHLGNIRNLNETINLHKLFNDSKTTFRIISWRNV